jgi:hypothetical protein
MVDGVWPGATSRSRLGPCSFGLDDARALGDLPTILDFISRADPRFSSLLLQLSHHRDTAVEKRRRRPDALQRVSAVRSFRTLGDD